MPWPVDAYMTRHPMPGGKLNVWTVDDDDPAPPTLVVDDRGWGPRWWRAGASDFQGPHRILFDYVKARDLRAARERAGFARKQCAKALGIDYEKWARYEKGTSGPCPRDVRILRAFMERAKTEQELNKK